MGMEKVYIIRGKYLDELVTSSSKGLVGKVMKRFELSSSTSDIKSQTRELIYEQFREFSKLLEAHQNGYEQSKWIFVEPKKEE